jgi:hypothetical protein
MATSSYQVCSIEQCERLALPPFDRGQRARKAGRLGQPKLARVAETTADSHCPQHQRHCPVDNKGLGL